MLTRLTRTLLTLMILMVFAPATTVAQELPFPFTIEGNWWCSMGNKGVMRLDFGSIFGGEFPVSGVGISSQFEETFQITETSGQVMNFEPTKNLVGTFDLRDANDTADIGTLEITRGRLNSFKTKMRLKGKLQLNGETERKVTLKCERIPETTPDWEGRTTDGRVRGQRVKSDKYDFQLTKHSTLGFPFFQLISFGPSTVDGDQMFVQITGIVGAQSNGRAFADLMSSDGGPQFVAFGEGFGKGKFRSPPTGFLNRPSIQLKNRFEQRKRVNYQGVLLEIVGN